MLILLLFTGSAKPSMQIFQSGIILPELNLLKILKLYTMINIDSTHKSYMVDLIFTIS